MSSNSVTSSAPQCTICTNPITTTVRRSTATLSCGHVFHLDCIGSQFNLQAIMQCPNCDKVEDGDWRFSSGGIQQVMEDDENDNYDEMVQQSYMLQYYMQHGFPSNLPRPQMIVNRQPTAPGSFHPAFVPAITQLRQNGWAPQPHYVPISSALSITLATPQGFDVGPTLGSPSHPNLPYHGYVPAPEGHAVGSSSQARHQANPPRNGWPEVRNIRVVQQQQRPSASAAAQAPLHLRASRPTSQSHRGIGTSMGQGAQPSYNHGSGRQPPRQTMGNYANMLHGHGPAEPLQNENDEDDFSNLHRFV